jgi:hypothetical protein
MRWSTATIMSGTLTVLLLLGLCGCIASTISMEFVLTRNVDVDVPRRSVRYQAYVVPQPLHPARVQWEEVWFESPPAQ